MQKELKCYPGYEIGIQTQSLPEFRFRPEFRKNSATISYPDAIYNILYNILEEKNNSSLI